jgi:hypothetical protein
MDCEQEIYENGIKFAHLIEYAERTFQRIEQGWADDPKGVSSYCDILFVAHSYYALYYCI